MLRLTHLKRLCVSSRPFRKLSAVTLVSCAVCMGKNQDHEHDCSFSCSHITQFLPSVPACQSVPCTWSPAVPGLSPSLLASESIAETLSCYTKRTNQLGLYIKLPNYWIHPQKQY